MAAILRQTRQCRSSSARAGKRMVTMVASFVAGVVVCGHGQNLFVATGDRQADSRTRVLLRGVNELTLDASMGALNPKYLSSNYRPGSYRPSGSLNSTAGSSGLLLAGGLVIAAAAMVLNSSMLGNKESAVSQVFDNSEDPMRTTKQIVSSTAVAPEMKMAMLSTTESPPVITRLLAMLGTKEFAVSQVFDDSEDPMRTTKQIVSSTAVAPEMKMAMLSTTESPPVFPSPSEVAETEVAEPATPVALSTPVASSSPKQKDATSKQAIWKAQRAGLAPNKVAVLRARLAH